MLDTLFHKYLRIPYQLHVHVDQKPKKFTTTVLLLHGMGNSGSAWDEVVTLLPNDIRVISVDLLGFGTSASPRWLRYSTSIQTKSVYATLRRLGVNKKLIIVGHSMGSLVATEFAKQYPTRVRSLILCSPPFYTDTQKRTLLPNRNALLKKFYGLVQKYPKNVVGATPVATRLKIVGKAFNVTSENVDVYMAALEASIVNQTGLADITVIRKPIHMIHGRFDPVVIKKNLDQIVKQNPYTSLSVVSAGHEMIGAYIPAVVSAIEKFTEIPAKPKSKA